MKRFLTSSEAAQILGVSTDSLRIWDNNGSLMPIKTAGGHRRYTQEQIEEFQTGGSNMNSNEYLRRIFQELGHDDYEEYESYFNKVSNIHKGFMPFIQCDLILEGTGPFAKIKGINLTNKPFYFFGPNSFISCRFPTEGSPFDKHFLSLTSYKSISIDLEISHISRPKETKLSINLPKKQIDLTSDYGPFSDQILEIYKSLVGKM